MRRVATTVVMAVGLFAIASCGGGAKGTGTGSKTPEAETTPAAFFEAYRAASLAGDVDTVWSMLAKSSQDSQIAQMETFRTTEGMAAMFGLTPDRLAATPTDKLARLALAIHLKDSRAGIEGTKLDHVEQQGPDNAIVHTTEPSGKITRGVLVRESGVWKLDLVATAKLEHGSDGISPPPVG
jgi:hypothetical protein